MILPAYAVEALDFTKETDYSSTYMISFILAGIILFIGVIASFTEGDLFPFGMGLFASVVVFGGTFIIAGSMQDDFSQGRVDTFQSWVSETYLIELNDTQSMDVLDNQINMKESSNSDDNQGSNKVVVKDPYGGFTEIVLVKNGKNWFILQSGSESPAVITKG